MHRDHADEHDALGCKPGTEAAAPVAGKDKVVDPNLDKSCKDLEEILQTASGGTATDKGLETAARSLLDSAQAVVNGSDVLLSGSASVRCHAKPVPEHVGGVSVFNSLTKESAAELSNANGILAAAIMRAEHATKDMKEGLNLQVSRISKYFTQAPAGGELPKSDVDDAANKLQSLSDSVSKPFADKKIDDDLGAPFDRAISNAKASLEKTKNSLDYVLGRIEKAKSGLNDGAVAQAKLQDMAQPIKSSYAALEGKYKELKSEYDKQAGADGKGGVLQEINDQRTPVQDMSKFVKYSVTAESSGGDSEKLPFKAFVDNVKQLSFNLPASIPEYKVSGAQDAERIRWIGDESGGKITDIKNVKAELQGSYDTFSSGAGSGNDGPAFTIHDTAAKREQASRQALEDNQNKLHTPVADAGSAAAEPSAPPAGEAPAAGSDEDEDSGPATEPTPAPAAGETAPEGTPPPPHHHGG